MYKYSDIKQIHLEVTQKCQASCPMCDRNQNGGKINPHINLDELSLQDCKKIFDKKFIMQLNTMYMCGNLGDPIIANDTLEIFDYFRTTNKTMWLSMNTNGGARDKNWWKDLAKVLRGSAAVIFSIDGLQDTNHLYRQGVLWENIEQNVKAFIGAGGRARWDYIVFEHNQHQIEQAKDMADKWGCERFQIKKTGRFVTSNLEPKDSHQSINKKGKNIFNLTKPEKKYQNSALSKINQLVQKHHSMDLYYDTVPINCKVKKIGSLFITAEGLALPCCWTAGRMYKWWHNDPKIEQIWKFIDDKDSINAKNGLKNVFDSGIFDKIEKSWKIKSCDNGKLKVCAVKCGIEFDPFTEQFS